MSLILEALRRSEAERRRGAPPNLLDPGEPTRPRREASWTIALAGLTAGLLIAGAAAWWWTRGLEAPAASTPPGVPAAPPSAPAPPASTPAASAVQAPIGPTAPVTAAPPARTPAAAAPAPAPTALPIVATPAPPEPPATPPVDAGVGPEAADLALADLAGAARDALPPLRVSMHVYAEDPLRRFAIVDGQRLREGDPFGPGAQLIEIRRDGLRVAWQGRTLWVPR